jgi:adenine-specific DNA-methyltransferase
MKLQINFERDRLKLQAALDEGKTSIDRNKLGQFATPTPLAHEILAYGLSLFPPNQKIRFLDPAIGTGSLYSALLHELGPKTIETAQGYEIDPHYGRPAIDLWKNSKLQIELTDFTTVQPPAKPFNLLICNPPYVRHHHLEKAEKHRLQIASQAAAGMHLSGLAGLYCHFLALTHPWLSTNGIAGWIVPSEFMDVNYGREIKRYLLEDVTLLRIHRFDTKDAQFADALVSSAIVWFKKAKPPVDHHIEFTCGGTHHHPILSRHIPTTELSINTKWTNYPNQKIQIITDIPTLSDFFDIKRGIATGSNDFFILNRAKIQELQIPLECFRPILPSPRHLNMDEISADQQGHPILPDPLFLLDCRLPEPEIQERYPTLWKYLESGKTTIASRYLCKSRRIWYWQESRASTPFVCTYMGRGNATNRPLRFLLNHSIAIVANTYMMVYPKPRLAQLIASEPSLIGLVWQKLQDISVADFRAEGRIYGGGLQKIEPKEMARLPAAQIRELISAF